MTLRSVTYMRAIALVLVWSTGLPASAQGVPQRRATTPRRHTPVFDDTAYARAVSGVTSLRDQSAGKDGIAGTIHSHAAGLVNNLAAAKGASGNSVEQSWLIVFTTVNTLDQLMIQPDAVGKERWAALCADVRALLEGSMTQAGRLSGSMCRAATAQTAATPDAAQAGAQVAGADQPDVMALVSSYVSRAILLEACQPGAAATTRSDLETFVRSRSVVQAPATLSQFDHLLSLHSQRVQIERAGCSAPDRQSKLKFASFQVDHEQKNFISRVAALQSQAATESRIAALPPDRTAQDPRIQKLPVESRELVAQEAARNKPHCENNHMLSNFFDCSCYAQTMLDTRLQLGAHVITVNSAGGRGGPALNPHWSDVLQKADLKACVSRPAVTKYAREKTNAVLIRDPRSERVGSCVAEQLYSKFKQKPAADMSYVDYLYSTILQECNR